MVIRNIETLLTYSRFRKVCKLSYVRMTLVIKCCVKMSMLKLLNSNPNVVYKAFNKVSFVLTHVKKFSFVKAVFKQERNDGHNMKCMVQYLPLTGNH